MTSKIVIAKMGATTIDLIRSTSRPRRNDSIGYCSPLEFENLLAKNQLSSQRELSTGEQRHSRTAADNPRFNALRRISTALNPTANLSVEAVIPQPRKSGRPLAFTLLVRS
ncbi:hypothetical protein FSB64_35275 [Paraburkholderia sp. JPY454]|uniref:Uncharacterized protein n=1 Tax=Paraburkholderia youngii TaxID=2782701 RepID=A0ABX2NXE9_9BURK|nr:hypothetical protein [Paraburkholderia youngii]